MRKTLATLGLCVALLVGAPSANATEPPPHPEIASAMAALPGGVLISPNEAEWPKLGIRFEVPSVTTFSVGSCATGTTCAYRNANLGGAKATFYGCSTWSTTAFGSVGSVANARTSGWAEVRNSSGGVITTVGYGTWKNVGAGTTSIACLGDGITGIGI